jgi:hypothetical protein
MSTPNEPPAQDQQQRELPKEQEPGTNAVEHEPDPRAQAIPDGQRRFIPRSPYTTGNY